MVHVQQVKLHLDSTLGAAFLGNMAAGVFYGITSVQTFVYYRSCHQDGQPFKILVFCLWLLDSIHLAFTTHGLYFYMITSFANPRAIGVPTWSLLSQVYITCISDFIVRSVFARRVWILSGQKRVVTFAILVTSLVVFASGCAFASMGFVKGTYAELNDDSWMLYCSLGSAVIADLLIAISLCIALKRSRTGFNRTNSLVNVLMLYSINTGLLTSICATACFITYAVWPGRFIFMGIYFALSKLYLNSLLATLNARATLREQSYGVSTIPSGLVSIPLNGFSHMENVPKPLKNSHRQSEGLVSSLRFEAVEGPEKGHDGS